MGERRRWSNTIDGGVGGQLGGGDVRSDARTVEEYLAELPADRREALSVVRETILERLPEGYVEGMAFGMIGYAIPLERYPKTHNKQPLPIAALASQKRYMVVYLNGVYGTSEEAEWFKAQFDAAGKKLDMGKSCVYFRKLDDLPLEVIGEEIARWPVERYIALYESVRRR